MQCIYVMLCYFILTLINVYNSKMLPNRAMLLQRIVVPLHPENRRNVKTVILKLNDKFTQCKRKRNINSVRNSSTLWISCIIYCHLCSSTAVFDLLLFVLLHSCVWFIVISAPPQLCLIYCYLCSSTAVFDLLLLVLTHSCVYIPPWSVTHVNDTICTLIEQR